MNVVCSNTLAGTRRRPLAVCLASIFSLSAPPAMAANTWFVNTCSEGVSNTDATHGSLRWAVAAAQAQSGDIIDMTGIGCSMISLTTGEIFVPQASLTIKGPTASVLTIDATGNAGGFHGPFTSRVLTHTGGGLLTVQFLTLMGGHAVRMGYPALGGCIYSAGNVSLQHAHVTGCYTYESGPYLSAGGGVYTKGELDLVSSTLTNNHANAADTADIEGVGGGAFVHGFSYNVGSTISGNTAKSRAGGVYTNGGALFQSSTISGNSADSFAGIMAYSLTPGGNHFSLGQSTVSGNTATGGTGAIYVNSGNAHFYSSTVAFNSAPIKAGVELNSTHGAMAVTLESMLVSNNSGGSSDDDLSIADGINPISINGGDVVTPANNLIRATNATLPTDTISSCPQLGPLRNNGGFTKTHALGSTSPAIDKGNTLGGVPPFDQRGDAADNGEKTYVRKSGPIGDIDPPVADIGAYEVQQDDEIFQTFFDGCNPLPLP
jgi:hypothetical protein